MRTRRVAWGRRRLLLAALAALMLTGLAFATPALAKPEYVLPPEVSGRVNVGGRLVCSSGEWKGAPKFSYEWIREGEVVAKQAGGAEGGTYVLSKADEHKEVWCIVTATTSGESTTVESANSVCLGGNCNTGPPPVPPFVEVSPEVTPPGTTAPNKTLTCVPGKWGGSPAPVFAYKWFREGTEPIANATSSSYVVKAEDETHKLSCRVTAQNSGGEETAVSKNSVEVPGTPPKNISAPKIFGSMSVGETLTCNVGEWSGSKPLTFKYQWLRGGAPIAGAIGETYVIEKGDEGQALICRVTAKNNAPEGEVSKESASRTVTLGKPENTHIPEVSPSGTVGVGTPLECSPGSWNQTGLTYEYHWLRENESIGTNSPKYTTVGGDANRFVSCQVTAKNTAGQTATATSAPVSVAPGAGAPQLTSGPNINGTRELGKTLTCASTWSNGPTSFVYQWLRNGAGIGLATSETYKVVSADQGQTLSCRVIAKNGEGASPPAESGEYYVLGVAPKVLEAPALTGPESAHAGDTLVCSRGRWEGAPTPEYNYEWLRDGSVVATTAPYVVQSADLGHVLSCRVTATNGEGQEAALSANSRTIPGIAPEPPVAGPTIAGEAAPGQTLTCQPGAWIGAPAPEFSYQWLIHNNPIEGATGQTLLVTGADRGFALSCRVTGSNKEGSSSAISKSVHVAGEAPQPLELPSVTGSATVGLTLTCEPGIWKGKPPPSFHYQWYRDSTPLEGATEQTHLIEASDQGHALTCNVLASNSEGSLEEESTNAIIVKPRTTTTNGGTVGKGGKPVAITASVLLASLKRQLMAALEHARLKSLLKLRSFSFAFVPPSAGKLEVQWLLVIPATHKSKSKLILIARGLRTYPNTKKSSIKLMLTSAGKHLLAHRRLAHLKLKGTYSTGHLKPVSWATTSLVKY